MATIRHFFKVVCTRRIPKVIRGAQSWRKEVMLFDRIALQRQDYTATKAERLQNAKHWILRLNGDGPQKPLRQRPELAAALKQCLDMQDAHLAEKRQSLRPIRPEHEQRQREDQQLER